MLALARQSRRSRFHLLLLGLALILTLSSCAKRERPASETIAQKTFASPAAAGAALFEAAKSADQNALMAIFGPEGKDLVFSGDPVKDKNQMQRFADTYSRMNRWSMRKSGDESSTSARTTFLFPSR